MKQLVHLICRCVRGRHIQFLVQVLCALKLGHTRNTSSNPSISKRQNSSHSHSHIKLSTRQLKAHKPCTIIVTSLMAGWPRVTNSASWRRLWLLQVILVWPSLIAHKTCTKNYVCRPRTRLQMKQTSCFLVAFFTLTIFLFFLMIMFISGLYS